MFVRYQVKQNAKEEVWQYMNNALISCELICAKRHSVVVVVRVMLSPMLDVPVYLKAF